MGKGERGGRRAFILFVQQRLTQKEPESQPHVHVQVPHIGLWPLDEAELP